MNWLRRLIRDRAEDICACDHPRGLHVVPGRPTGGWIWEIACRALVLRGEGEIESPITGFVVLPMTDCNCPGFEEAW